MSRRREGNLTALDEVLPGAMGRLGRRGSPGQGAGALRVFAAFARIGPPLTDQARPVSWRGGLLTLEVLSSPWLTELSFMQETLRTRLNKLLGEPDRVQRLRLRLGSGPTMAREIVVLPALTEPERAQVEAWTAQVPAPLQESFRRAAARNLQAKLRLPPGVAGPPGPQPAPDRSPSGGWPAVGPDDGWM